MHVLRKPRVEQLHRKLLNREIDRRDFMAVAATAGLAPVASSLMSPARAAEGDMIHYFTWSAYEVPELHQPFVDKYGQSPNWSVFASAEDGLQKIRAGFVADLAHPCVDNVPRWHDAGALQPLDTSRIDHWDDMFPALHTMNGATINGDVYMAITDFGLSSMIYRTDIVEGEESWMYMYDEKYAGRICARNTTASIFVPLKILGYDPMNPTPEQVAEAADMARKQRDLVRFYWGQPDRHGTGHRFRRMRRRLCLERGPGQSSQPGHSGRLRGAQGRRLRLGLWSRLPFRSRERRTDGV